MDLCKIKDPSILKEMNMKQLEQLAEETRQFLIENLSTTGGHLGANLGVVELTLALHKVYKSPEDRFIWDVGHQSYIHKILTGRGSQFDTLRQYKGLCGFPKRDESEHDVWETGHSSTSLSAAMGMAIARDLKNENHSILPIIGDGALTGGMALEALNHIGHEKKNVTVILNDNEMSIAKNVGALHGALGRMRSAGKYHRVKDDLEWVLKKIPAVGGRIAQAAERLKDSMKYFVVPGMFFEELGFTYYGPVDGHDFNDLIENLNYAKKTDGPVIVHVMTQKGKGYHPAETDVKDKWHGVGPYKIESGEKIKPVDAPPAWSSVISEALRQEARQDSRIVAVTPAMILGSKLEKFGEEFPDRLFDVGIAEQHATTMSAGLATQGMKPFLVIYSTFLQRGYDQVVHDVARQKLNVIFGIDRAGLVGADGETHQGVFDIAFLRSIPNMVITMPKDENEAQHLVHTATKYDDGPFAIRYPRGNAKDVATDEHTRTIPVGSWEVLKEGSDGVILTFGTTIDMALEASEKMEKEGRSIKVVNARYIKPLDDGMLHDLMKSRMPILTVEEAVLKGGFGSSILEFAEENGYTSQWIKRIGVPDRFIEHGNVPKLWEEIGLTRENIVQQMKQLIPNKQQRA
ncbi:1-deoxy-D-xylulose-5-phosphate synthase [Halobacillus karajensis]|uniref:1-deoxy-D-xylulose-5-phosphate synthase n=1 Tax=Halobacillus karajensis TaxID=195088 RepID=A0A024P5Z3_9BACI|nr:1-deoxy-D-xylulose-5-phosphate synthase [Halobacillus karajensis]CDQ17889.1 1-deoxy-D-xylulose-5-phosphate synthase [Halobacillus karajensis]CDQ24295.1 1-deoxy-D-xylulose-5-phosphate synthase [Halobacillus karajensis]CDQ29456.1 1-deoxy-D-xylulose-5-phosphate synthase [Halobacillus karajensis]